MTDDMNELIRAAARRRTRLDERLSPRPEEAEEERPTSFDGGVRGKAPLSDEPDMNWDGSAATNTTDRPEAVRR